MKRVFLITILLGILETFLVWFFKAGEAALSFGAAQGVMLVNLVLLTYLWRAIITKKKIAHISILIVLKVLFLFSSAWLVLGKVAPLSIWSVGGFFCFFMALTLAGSFKRASYEF